jgi:hypothetical protein
MDIEISPITIGTVYTSLMNLDCVLFIDVRRAPIAVKVDLILVGHTIGLCFP